MPPSSSSETLSHLRFWRLQRAGAALAVASTAAADVRTRTEDLQAAIARQHQSLGRQLPAGVPAADIARYARTVAEFSAELATGQEQLDELETQLFGRREAATAAVREYRAVAMLIARRRAARRRRALTRQGAMIDTLSLARWQAGGLW